MRHHHDPKRSPRSPSLRLLGLEPVRAALEYAGHRLMPSNGWPRGDGHPVIVFPGLATDGHATAPLRRFCERLGYEVHDWGRGFNVGPDGDAETWLCDLSSEVEGLLKGNARRASLVGWSLGGIYAREVAKLLPRRVRRVITIGTPLTGDPSQTNASWLYQVVNGSPPVPDRRLHARLRQPPRVPTTAIFSRSDGVVAWQSCVQPGHPDEVDNVEIDGSHCGMGWNPSVLEVVASRLAEPAPGPGA